MVVATRRRLGWAFAALVLGGQGCTCGKGGSSDEAGAAPSASSSAPLVAADGGASGEAGAVSGLSAPIAAARSDNGDVIVAALDVPLKALRVQRIDAKDAIVKERTILEGSIVWSSDAELKMAPAAGGVVITARGLTAKRSGQLVVLGADLAPKGDVMDVAPSTCATELALWSTDGTHVRARPWTGKPAYGSLPKEKDVAFTCGTHRAFALLDEDNGTSVSVLTAGGADAGVPAEGGVQIAPPVPLLVDSEFGEDEQRERSDYTVGDDLGVVRLASSGLVAVRELSGATAGPLHKLKTQIPRDDDVVTVDASAKSLVVVYTQDASEGCTGDGGPPMASTKVMALRVDRKTWEETTVELSPGMCGREVGPFFTGAIGDAIRVGWVERAPVRGKSQAPVVALAHRSVPAAGDLAVPLARIDVSADALVDAGCDAERCYAVALARRPGADVMVPGFARVLRY
ncbi:MAG: hypothetical protein JST00_39115 [Deltaproteobacteria bacterium]|nr:hypothetical protein [Deltaproteobacteria bacterium]